MPTRGFAYNPTQASISGTSNLDTLCIQEQSLDLSSSPGGLTWWMGPEETGVYIIAKDVPSEDFPTPIGDIGGVQFWSCSNNDSAFISLVNRISSSTQASASAASNWLLSNNYWTSYDINAQGFSYSDFSSTVGLTAVGNASVASNIYNLTTAGNGQVGNVYRTTAIQYNRNFSAQWSTFIGGGTGADGYCIQWTPTNNTNGSAGGGVGYVSTAINAITFLTYTNNNFTWYKNNVSQGATSVTSGFWRQALYFWADYNHSAQTFALYWNTTNSKPVSPNKTFTSFLFDTGSYYMGFGAATGGANDNHELLSWVLTFT